MSAELSKVYDPKSVEKEVYARWEAAGAFDAEAGAPGEPYCIVIPPPNVTAALHLGHALNNTLQDVLIRWRRMQGYNALWMPGTDHAGIATQAVVDKRLLAAGEGGIAKFRQLEAEGKDGRAQFVAKVQAWKDEYEQTILHQLKQMGCSCDWRRTRFTMDEQCAKAVRAAFFKLFADGLIYRGKRLVNWDPATQTVLADDEVEHETVQGHFWYLKYPLVEKASVAGVTVEHVTVATTRPETMLGDTAVAMNPRDPRAAALVGKMVRLPIVGRLIPIILDDHVVLPNPTSDDEKARFSTGFLKVTPAHDPDDYAIRERCVARGEPIDIINILAPDGTISHRHGWTDWEQVSKNADGSPNTDLQELIGMDRFEAREAVVEFFRKEHLLEEVRPYTHEVGHSYRSHVPIEPYLSDQWYIAVKKPISDFGLRISDCGSSGPNSASKGQPPARLGHFSDPGASTQVPSDPGHSSDRADASKTASGLSTGDRSSRDQSSEPIRYIEGTDVPVNSLAGIALAPLLDGRLKFIPDRYGKNYQTWLENLRDWPISRQLWWGHQIPVWSVYLVDAAPGNAEESVAEMATDLLKRIAGRLGLGDSIVVEPRRTDVEWSLLVCSRGSNADAMLSAIRAFYGNAEWPESLAPVANDAKHLCELLDGIQQDPDVLDTWFSSSLWPFSTMGWPDVTPELKTFYPGDVLCTAREIITLWVSRMVMMGQYCRGEPPFSDVFIHAMIQDGEGRKMSKSLGNGIDPLDIIDSHGADAMRFTLVSMTTQTQDVRMPVASMKLPDGRQVNSSPKFDMGRNFCNKLWNASRFAMMNLRPCPAWGEVRASASLSDRWILSRLNATIRDATAALDGYRFNELGDTLYHFLWDDFCDWYLEIAKSRINAGENQPRAVLAHCLDVVLRLLHPVAPFITEAIWSNLNQTAPMRGPGMQEAEPLLARAAWPRADAAAIDAKAESDFATLQELIRQVRNVRTQHNVPPGKSLSVQAHVEAGATNLAALLSANLDLFRSLANLEQMKVQVEAAEATPPPADAASIAAAGVKLYVLGAVDRAAELARLTKQQGMLVKGIGAIEAKLGNAGFLAKAPPAVVEKERLRMEGLKAELAAVEKSLAALKE